MPRDIFTDVTRPPAKLGSQAWYTVPASILTHAAIVAILVIIPLVSADIVPLPTPDLIVVASAPPPPPPPEPVAPPAVSHTANATAPSNPVVAPTIAPDNIGEEVPGPPAPPGVRIDGPPGMSTGTLGAISSGVLLPEPPPPAVTKPMRVGTGVMYPKKTRDVRPIYPKIAIDARVQGIVTIEAIIGVDGRVKDAKVVRSIPLLDRAALEAVNQWLFSPTQLNGVPVPVIITITVDFKLN